MITENMDQEQLDKFNASLIAGSAAEQRREEAAARRRFAQRFGQ